MKAVVCIGFLHLAAGLKQAVTPTEKVIELLNNLKAEVEKEGSAQATTYETFSCFCKDKTKSLSDNIKSGKDNIDSLSAEIELKTATKEQKTTELQDAKVKLDELQTSLKETEVRAAKEKAEYEANDADLRKAISSLEQAIKAMSDSNMEKKTAGLITMKRSIVQQKAIDDAMRLVDAGPAWKKNGAFLQASVDPNDPAFKYHSHDIIATMQKLLEEFTQKKADADAEYAKMKAASDKMILDLNTEIGTTSDLITTLETDIEALTVRLAEARSELIDADAMLKDDKLYLTDLTVLCEKRAGEWDQRSKLRADEVQALSEAIGILDGVVLGKSEVSERALIQQPASFLQRAAVQEHSAAQLQDEHKAQALQLLGLEGRRLGSTVLSAIVARAAADPFTKIKTLIQNLVERLIREATEEATKKGFCDTETGKATKDRDYRLEDVLKLNAETAELEVKQDELELEIGDLSTRLKDLAATANETADMREDDKADNLYTLSEAKEGLEAVKQAVGILKTFYKSAAKNEKYLSGELNKVDLVQTSASPVDEDNPGAGFDGAYEGSQAKSKGIIGLLEVIQSDFERTIAQTEKAEKEAAADYVQFDRATQTEQSGKGTKKGLNGEDLETTKLKIEQNMQDMKSNMDLLDSALKQLEELVPMCVDNVMSYEDRVAKREEEIAALGRALCILDADGVEPDCQSGGEMPLK